MYKPRPIDTSGIELPDDLRGLVEELAENTHDVWTQARMMEGWAYGPKRDDSKKQHPNLVPYSELSESEREFDRATVIQTLKVMIMLGHEIKKR